MLYTVEEVAIQLNVSKQSIYNKLKLKEYKDKVLMKQGKSMIDDTLLNLIKDNLKVKTNLNMNENIEPVAEEEKTQDTILDDDLSNLNKELINTLLEQLKTKDQQIQELNNRLAQEQDNLKNMQVLYLKQQPQDIKVLEEHFQDIDNKLIDIKGQMQERKEEQESKGLFKKLFKK